jgi:L-2,4-diaminobutyric acid acetyltransferase
MSIPPAVPDTHHHDLLLMPPDNTLGHQVAELVNRCPPLDTNSTYCNLLQCHHFANTSCAALTPNKRLVGFVSGYIVPQAPDTLFIWQVAVDHSQRGK